MSRIEIFKNRIEIMKDLMFKIVCEAMQLRSDDDIYVLEEKIKKLKLSVEVLEDKLERFYLK